MLAKIRIVRIFAEVIDLIKFIICKKWIIKRYMTIYASAWV